jgi:hypothetical protein
MKKIIYLEWYDAETEDAWACMNETKKDAELPVIKTVGFLIKKTSDLYIVSASIDEKNLQVCQTIKIPTRWVKTKKFIACK